jgi:hypothetical protein
MFMVDKEWMGCISSLAEALPDSLAALLVDEKRASLFSLQAGYAW